MTERVTVGSQYYAPIQSRFPKHHDKPATSTTSAESATFRTILDGAMVRFSQHAEQRLQQRGIQLEPEQLAKLGGAIDRAASKGSKESLVLFQDMAFIVNIQNRTVVTAMDDSSMQNHVFTQIDSTVLVR